jgi:hypothetical protein
MSLIELIVDGCRLPNASMTPLALLGVLEERTAVTVSVLGVGC